MEQPSWRASAACGRLTPRESDEIFFPGSGGKPTRAKEFCSNARCPVVQECLNAAIVSNLEGFYAGTTKNERNIMREYHEIATTPINQIVSDSLQDSVKPRKNSRKNPPALADTLDFLDTIKGHPLDSFLD